jgi:hypothetical protein
MDREADLEAVLVEGEEVKEEEVKVEEVASSAPRVRLRRLIAGRRPPAELIRSSLAQRAIGPRTVLLRTMHRDPSPTEEELVQAAREEEAEETASSATNVSRCSIDHWVRSLSFFSLLA